MKCTASKIWEGKKKKKRTLLKRVYTNMQGSIQITGQHL